MNNDVLKDSTVVPSEEAALKMRTEAALVRMKNTEVRAHLSAFFANPNRNGVSFPQLEGVEFEVVPDARGPYVNVTFDGEVKRVPLKLGTVLLGTVFGQEVGRALRPPPGEVDLTYVTGDIHGCSAHVHPASEVGGHANGVYPMGNHEHAVSLMIMSMAGVHAGVSCHSDTYQSVDVEDVKCRLKGAISEEESRNVVVTTLPSAPSVAFDNMVRELVTKKADSRADTSAPKVKAKPAVYGLNIVRT